MGENKRFLAHQPCCFECDECAARPGFQILCIECRKRRAICAEQHGGNYTEILGKAPRSLALMFVEVCNDADRGRAFRSIPPGSTIYTPFPGELLELTVPDAAGGQTYRAATLEEACRKAGLG